MYILIFTIDLQVDGIGLWISACDLRISGCNPVVQQEALGFVMAWGRLCKGKEKSMRRCGGGISISPQSPHRVGASEEKAGAAKSHWEMVAPLIIINSKKM